MRRTKKLEVTWQTTTWQAASLLLDYPDDELMARQALLRRAVGELPPPAAEPLGRFLDHLARTPLSRLAEGYVKTFDHQRRCCLYLTYYAHGDTRNRGMALLRFKNAYRIAGLELTEDELPDHLCVVLEFAATVNPDEGRRLLLEHRAGIEVLRLALQDAGSPYADVVQAVSATLPALPGEDREAVLRLAAKGPPVEEVGLAPFAPPEYMPEPQAVRR